MIAVVYSDTSHVAPLVGVAVGLAARVSERAERLLHPISGMVVVPLFALVNAGVVLDGAGGRVTVAVIVGLVVGKLVGISLASALAVRLGAGRLPEGVTWTHLAGGAALAGIGFTVSLFITDIAFTDAGLVADAKLGILAGSVLAAVAGAAILLAAARRYRSTPL